MGQAKGMSHRGRQYGLPLKVKRTVDLIVSFAFLTAFSPVLFAIGILLFVTMGRPILFRQQRPGRYGRPFTLLKFRTMREARNTDGRLLADEARLTALGKVLRELSLDELPQLWNVLRGDMSLVGPRPEVPEYVQMETPIWQTILQVRPGVTDLATLLYRDEEKLLGTASDPNAFYCETVLPAKLIVNLGYLKYRSIWRDLNLIVLTICYSIFPERFDADLIKRTVGMGVLS